MRDDGCEEVLCCDGGGDLAVPSHHRLQGVVSGLLGAWQGRRKRNPLGAGWEPGQVWQKPPFHIAKWPLAGILQWSDMGSMGHPDRAWHGTAGVVPLVPPQSRANPITVAVLWRCVLLECAACGAALGWFSMEGGVCACALCYQLW